MTYNSITMLPSYSLLGLAKARGFDEIKDESRWASMGVRGERDV